MAFLWYILALVRVLGLVALYGGSHSLWSSPLAVKAFVAGAPALMAMISTKQQPRSIVWIAQPTTDLSGLLWKGPMEKILSIEVPTRNFGFFTYFTTGCEALVEKPLTKFF